MKQTKIEKRTERLMPNGIPKYVRCYDNGGKSFDRYTIVFTGNFKGRDCCLYLSASENPFHPQGFGQHGDSNTIIDKPTYSHLGKKVKFKDLPKNAQTFVINDYKSIWFI